MTGAVKNIKTGKKLFLSALQGGRSNRIPFWFMRQAGRYLPEYRELRARAGGFLDMVYNPDFATEVTMQPLRRYGMDAAILFSDILVIPHALGQKLEFLHGEGPKFEPIRCEEDFKNLEYTEAILAPVYETIKSLKSQIQKEGFYDTALIGFAGAPWTVATYMVEGGSSRTFENVKKWAYCNPETFERLIELITQTTIRYLLSQIKAGVEAIQIFDSWAGVLDESEYNRWVIIPTKKITQALAQSHPDIPVIGFPKGSGFLYEVYAKKTGVTALGLDSQVPLEKADFLQDILPVQGNLDPVCLLTGGMSLKNTAEKILEKLSAKPFIFNLGHGVIKETPPEHMAVLSEIIKNWRI
ncbi:MAG: uroporphyrinogen decarboxylase [Alphaproteobacteria bacterium CG_4_9_14_3_um_filter_47_13]|nr:MAG: uroporphyrinogen decarboxylase [Alphaproteobacteria bacterium CG_4_9_14_3_um_filter_47_13]